MLFVSSLLLSFPPKIYTIFFLSLLQTTPHEFLSSNSFPCTTHIFSHIIMFSIFNRKISLQFLESSLLWQNPPNRKHTFSLYPLLKSNDISLQEVQEDISFTIIYIKLFTFLLSFPSYYQY